MKTKRNQQEINDFYKKYLPKVDETSDSIKPNGNFRMIWECDKPKSLTTTSIF